MAPIATATSSAAAAPASVSKNLERIQPDPEVVQYPNFEADPTSQEEFFKRAGHVADLLHQDEAIRDRGNVVPYRQVQLLKDAGLVTLLGPKEARGGGQTWKEAYRIIRIIATGDGSLAQLLGYHYLWYWATALVGTDEQRSRLDAKFTREKAFFGGAVNPRDADLFVSESPTDPTKLVFHGKKTFSTGQRPLTHLSAYSF